jgi:hypothetical protein
MKAANEGTSPGGAPDNDENTTTFIKQQTNNNKNSLRRLGLLIGRGRDRALIPTSEMVHSHHKVTYNMS